MVGAIAWIMLGLIAGKARYGVVVTTLVGIAGALSAVLLLAYHVITSSSTRRARR
jgi:uncharacterized membrane protein YeaQ/YmgE (transglycosylase-associated protein family)